jgi:hypothetical protein
MYASAFDLRPQPGEMVVSRSDVKRRRKEGNAPEESIQGSPKRYKVYNTVLYFVSTVFSILCTQLSLSSIFNS